MSKALLIAGGVLNTLFVLFHVLLGFQIDHLTEVSAPYRALMEALNAGGVLFIFFLAYVSFFYGVELIESRLGRVVLLLAAALYLSRAAEELFLFKFTPTIFASCVVVGAVYLALVVISLKYEASRRLEAGERTAELRHAV